MPRSFSFKLHSEPQVSGRRGMSGARSPRHAQNPLSGERRKTLSITHNAPLITSRGTGMIASSSTYRDLFRQLHAIRHGTEALVY